MAALEVSQQFGDHHAKAIHKAVGEHMYEEGAEYDHPTPAAVGREWATADNHTF
jgi:hypothetical protein